MATFFSLWPAVYVLLTIVGFMALRYHYKHLRPQVESIEKEQLKSLQLDGYEVWDVRSEREWDVSPILGARQCSYNQLSLPNPELGVICVCNSGIRAQQAAENLKEMGHSKVFWLKGTHMDCIKQLSE